MVKRLKATIAKSNGLKQFIPQPKYFFNNKIFKNLEFNKKKRFSHLRRRNIIITNKSKKYKSLQNFYDNDYFSYNVLKKINSIKECKLNNNVLLPKYDIFRFLKTISSDFKLTMLKGFLPLTSSRKTLGFLNNVIHNKIDQGAEAIVIKNSQFAVGKIVHGEKSYILKRNSIPHALPVKFIGYFKDGKQRFPAFIQQKVKILNNNNFNRYVNKLDQMMREKGFFKINDPQVQYRAYTNGIIVIDDISPGNVGIDLLGRPRLVDFNILTLQQWLEQGFILNKNCKLYKVFKNKNANTK